MIAKIRVQYRAEYGSLPASNPRAFFTNASNSLAKLMLAERMVTKRLGLRIRDFGAVEEPEIAASLRSSQ